MDSTGKNESSCKYDIPDSFSQANLNQLDLETPQEDAKDGSVDLQPDSHGTVVFTKAGGTPQYRGRISSSNEQKLHQMRKVAQGNPPAQKIVYQTEQRAQERQKLHQDGFSAKALHVTNLHLKSQVRPQSASTKKLKPKEIRQNYMEKIQETTQVSEAALGDQMNAALLQDQSARPSLRNVFKMSKQPDLLKPPSTMLPAHFSRLMVQTPSQFSFTQALLLSNQHERSRLSATASTGALLFTNPARQLRQGAHSASRRPGTAVLKKDHNQCASVATLTVQSAKGTSSRMILSKACVDSTLKKELAKFRPKVVQKERESLYDDVMKQKLETNSLRTDNKRLKTKLAVAEAEITNRDRLIQDFAARKTSELESATGVKRGQVLSMSPKRQGYGTTAEGASLIGNLKRWVKELMRENEKKSEEIIKLNSNQLRTRMKEMEFENLAYQQECQRLRGQLEDLLVKQNSDSDLAELAQHKRLVVQTEHKNMRLQMQLVRRVEEGKALAEIIQKLENRLKKVVSLNKGNHKGNKEFKDKEKELIQLRKNVMDLRHQNSLQAKEKIATPSSPVMKAQIVFSPVKSSKPVSMASPTGGTWTRRHSSKPSLSEKPPSEKYQPIIKQLQEESQGLKDDLSKQKESNSGLEHKLKEAKDRLMVVTSTKGRFENLSDQQALHITDLEDQLGQAKSEIGLMKEAAAAAAQVVAAKVEMVEELNLEQSAPLMTIPADTNNYETPRGDERPSNDAVKYTLSQDNAAEISLHIPIQQEEVVQVQEPPEEQKVEPLSSGFQSSTRIKKITSSSFKSDSSSTGYNNSYGYDPASNSVKRKTKNLPPADYRAEVSATAILEQLGIKDNYGEDEDEKKSVHFKDLPTVKRLESTEKKEKPEVDEQVSKMLEEETLNMAEQVFRRIANVFLSGDKEKSSLRQVFADKVYTETIDGQQIEILSPDCFVREVKENLGLADLTETQAAVVLKFITYDELQGRIDFSNLTSILEGFGVYSNQNSARGLPQTEDIRTMMRQRSTLTELSPIRRRPSQWDVKKLDRNSLEILELLMIHLLETELTVKDLFKEVIFEQSVQTQKRSLNLTLMLSENFFKVLHDKGITEDEKEYANLRKYLQLDPETPTLMLVRNIRKALEILREEDSMLEDEINAGDLKLQEEKILAQIEAGELFTRMGTQISITGK